MIGTKNIKIRYLPTDVVHRLDAQATSGGFKSRNEYLLAKLTELSLKEMNLEAKQAYHQLLIRLTEVVGHNTQALNKVNELYELLLETDE